MSSRDRPASLSAVTSRISHTTFDALNSYTQSVFWTKVLGFAEDPADPNLPGHEECMIFSPDGTQQVLFVEVPDAKQLKNRMHFDLVPVEGRRDAELARLLDIGATVVADLRRPDGGGWVTLADPEGNEFCILRNAAEKAGS